MVSVMKSLNKWKSSAQFHGFTWTSRDNNNCSENGSLFKSGIFLISKTVGISIFVNYMGLGVETFFLAAARTLPANRFITSIMHKGVIM